MRETATTPLGRGGAPEMLEENMREKERRNVWMEGWASGMEAEERKKRKEKN